MNSKIKNIIKEKNYEILASIITECPFDELKEEDFVFLKKLIKQTDKNSLVQIYEEVFIDKNYHGLIENNYLQFLLKQNIKPNLNFLNKCLEGGFKNYIMSLFEYNSELFNPCKFILDKCLEQNPFNDYDRVFIYLLLEENFEIFNVVSNFGEAPLEEQTALLTLFYEDSPEIQKRGILLNNKSNIVFDHNNDISWEVDFLNSPVLKSLKWQSNEIFIKSLVQNAYTYGEAASLEKVQHIFNQLTSNCQKVFLEEMVDGLTLPKDTQKAQRRKALLGMKENLAFLEKYLNTKILQNKNIEASTFKLKKEEIEALKMSIYLDSQKNYKKNKL